MKHASFTLPRPVLLAAVGLVAGCATSSPLSYLTGQQITERTAINRVPVQIESVDGHPASWGRAPIPPGVHRVVISAPPPPGFRTPVEKTYTLNIAPCTEYFLAADRRNRLMEDWNLVVEDRMPVGGCNPAEEWKKSDTGPASGTDAVILGG